MNSYSGFTMIIRIVLAVCLSCPVSAYALDGLVDCSDIDKETRCAISRSKRCDIKKALEYGLTETGLQPEFPESMMCRDIDSEQWAISYTHKRPREAYHGGIDMPAPFGTPIVAVADGTVVALYEGKKSHRGREIILRHTPEETGLPYWIYTQYAHFDAMPDFRIGDRVKMGQELGPTGNSGIKGKSRKETRRYGKKARRPAIHFAVWYTDQPEFCDNGRTIVPKGGRWMDPNALYRGKPPFDSTELEALPEGEKKVRIPVMVEGGEFVPSNTKAIWPYRCVPE